MANENVTAGDKIAKAIGMRYVEIGEKATPAFQVAFRFTEPSTGTAEIMYWNAWLTETAKAKNVERLVDVLGWNGSMTLNPVDGTFTDPNVLDFAREVQLEIEEEIYDGKSRMKIKWVNKLGGSGYGKVAPELIQTKVKGLGLEALFVKVSGGKPAGAKTGAPKLNSSEEIPF